MYNLVSPKVVKQLMMRHGVAFNKGLGQNFLIDRNILEKIVEAADIKTHDLVLEIGAGIGTLTRELAGRAELVVSVEIDKRLFPILDETLSDCPNVRLVHGDILKLDIENLIRENFANRPFKIVANLPYYITTPVLMTFLEKGLWFEVMVVMVQKEVARRLTASPGTEDYGLLSVAVQYYTCPTIVATASAKVFMPPPKVDSAIVMLKKRVAPPVKLKEPEVFFRVVRAAFGQRRKTLLNALAALETGGGDKQRMEHILRKCNIDPWIRGELLSLQQFADIANALVDCNISF
ncbi:MAG: 16S rRNA (adenine(1518)-N(6)/adenine(1519)-N(6))-dimethyltransferase RsmA [Clostridiales bacterium]|jgi:16S rRNA (adenine1518-N6/adenine1519-N6)-dimethyltransferase|nr:16S rRNA (adenine(1518)-N(6)/adenine(1519)-N(6))-dimethyltransferase RsmA [Clostridiales bacterium]